MFMQQELDRLRASENRLQNQLDNRDQTQTILGTIGRWVGWAPSGSQALAATSG